MEYNYMVNISIYLIITLTVRLSIEKFEKNHEQSAKSNGVCIATVSNTIKYYVEKGLDSVTALERNVNSDYTKRKVDGRTAAKLIEIACGPAPEGHSRWTLRLLEDKA
jgi:hypothetical protein